MVFHYTIRGGQCRNNSSNIYLSSEDITCYVGRDKHENEFLIKYGWQGDIWFHVEGLSSAHVYFRVTKLAENLNIPIDGIPIDDLPIESIEDMMQIVKHNSISGSKLSSCKIVWTAHSNLKKTFDMDSGTVTYHNPKLCRYGRCDKDRIRIKALEKTKIERHNVNYYEEMKYNERKIIERKKREKNRTGTEEMLYDPIQADEDYTNLKIGRQGDDQSGLDTGLAQLEGLNFGTGMTTTDHPMPSSSAGVVDNNHVDNEESDNNNNNPIWMKESECRSKEKSTKIRFLRERGYNKEDAIQVLLADNNNINNETAISAVQALAKLWRKDIVAEENGEQVTSLSPDEEEIKELQQEENEVLRAIFLEDDDGVQFASSTDDDDADEDDGNGDGSGGSIGFDAILPITAYEPPERYGLPPPLVLEIYVDNGIASKYPYEVPVLALVGGGLPERYLQKLTDKVRQECYNRIQEERGEPQIFNLIGSVGEVIESILDEEVAEIELQRKQQLEEAKKAAAEEKAKRNKEQLLASNQENGEAHGGSSNYKSEAERRQYAKDVVAATAAATGGQSSQQQNNKKKDTKKHYDTGVSDQKLIEDLFG